MFVSCTSRHSLAPSYDVRTASANTVGEDVTLITSSLIGWDCFHVTWNDSYIETDPGQTLLSLNFFRKIHLHICTALRHTWHQQTLDVVIFGEESSKHFEHIDPTLPCRIDIYSTSIRGSLLYGNCLTRTNTCQGRSCRLNGLHNGNFWLSR